MKNSLIIVLIIFVSAFAKAQTAEIPPAPDDKSVVYFVRWNNTGSLINFTFFDSTQVIGKFNGTKYLRYECEPGRHLFWARSENRSYIQANLEPGKIYVIDVIPTMGAIKAGVRLIPVNDENYKLKPIQKLLAKRPPEVFSRSHLEALNKTHYDIVDRGMERLENVDYNKIPGLGGYSLTPQQLVFVPKKKRK